MSGNAQPPRSDMEIETRALTVGKWANLVMAVAGVVTALLSHSDAMLVDGLYSAVNFLSAIVAARIGLSIARPANRRRPWGYDFDEALYVTFRSMILIGILIFALFVSLSKIATYLTGGAVPTLVFGPIAVYAVTVVLICAGLAYNYHRAYVTTGRRSAILQTESKASLIDGAISLGAGGALLSLPFLPGTVLEPLIPIGDALIVVVLVALIIWQPVSLFLRSLADLAGISAPPATVAAVARRTRAAALETGFRYLRCAVLRAGRSHYVAVYLDPQRSVTAAEIDAFQARLRTALDEAIGSLRLEVIITERRGPETGDARLLP